MPPQLQFAFIRILGFIPVMAVLGLAGCLSTPSTQTLPGETRGNLAQSTGKAEMCTGRLFTKAEILRLLPRAFVGDEVYAEVNSRWLDSYYRKFRAELFRLGVGRWDARFDCNRFAELYSGIAQTVFLRESFHAQNAANALAIGPYWYRRANGRGYHAIVQVLTERGLVFVDPQTGGLVQLTPAEMASAYLQTI